MADKGEKFFKNVLSATIDSIPGIGNAKSAIELIIGKDLITQDELDDVDKALTGASLFLSGGAKVFGKAAKASSKGGNFLRKAETFTKEASNICDKVSDVKRFNECDDE